MTWLRDVRWGPFLTGTATLVPMRHIEGLDRDQAQLLPARVDDYVEADNPVRFIDAFVDGLDLQEAGFARVQPKPTGRPGSRPLLISVRTTAMRSRPSSGRLFFSVASWICSAES